MEVSLEILFSGATTILLGVAAFFMRRFASKVDKLSDSVVDLSKSVAVLDSEHRLSCDAMGARIEEASERSQIHWTQQRLINKEHAKRIDRLEIG